MKKETREELEYKSMFTDERYAKKAWKTLIGASLQSDAAPLPTFLDKNGNISPQSELDQMAYENVKKRLLSQNKTREPMQAELIVECAILRSRLDNNTFNVILDRTAGKVKEELTVTANQYEEMSDEELEMLAAYREQKALTQSQETDNTEGNENDNS